jgi:putative heme-binding domain-containing protein
VTAAGRLLGEGTPEARLQAVRILQARQLKEFDNLLEEIAFGTALPPELRVEAILALSDRLTSVQESQLLFLLARLDEDVAPLERLAAARALAAVPLDDRQLTRLAGELNRAGPLALPVLLRAFARSKNEAVGIVLVDTLNKSDAATNLSADELASILGGYPTNVQSKANSLLKRLGVDLEQQRARMEELAVLASGGDSARGHALFFSKKAACSSCHTVAGKGGKVGPDLTTIGRIRTARDLTEAIVFPSASFAREFRTYSILTEQGLVHTGVISRQTSDMVVLRTAELAEIRIARASIEEMRESSASIMPKGLDKTLSPEELRDLLAYLQSLKQ